MKKRENARLKKPTTVKNPGSVLLQYVDQLTYNDLRHWRILQLILYFFPSSLHGLRLSGFRLLGCGTVE